METAASAAPIPLVIMCVFEGFLLDIFRHVYRSFLSFE